MTVDLLGFDSLYFFFLRLFPVRYPTKDFAKMIHHAVVGNASVATHERIEYGNLHSQ